MTNASGMLVLWHDIAAGHEAQVRAWYAQEHHFERLDIPGFLAVRRWDRVTGQGAQVLGQYTVQSPTVLGSETYRARLSAPSERTRATMPHFRRMSRTVCRMAAGNGRAEGGHLAALAFAQGAPADAQTLCDALAAGEGVLSVCCIVAADAAAPAAAAPVNAGAESSLRGGPDASIAWALLIDADSGSAASQALEAAHEATARAPAVQDAVYRLAFAARNQG